MYQVQHDMIGTESWFLQSRVSKSVPLAISCDRKARELGLGESNSETRSPFYLHFCSWQNTFY